MNETIQSTVCALEKRQISILFCIKSWYSGQLKLDFSQQKNPYGRKGSMYDFSNYIIYIRPGVTDMRKRAESLSLLVRSEMGMDPMTRSIFLFCGRDRKRISAIVWDGNGYLEISKRLHVDMSFKWPRSEEEALMVTRDEVEEMLSGGDPWRRFPRF